MEDIINKRFGDYIVLEDLGRRNNNRYYRVKCTVCGHEKECSINNLRKQNNTHSKFNCKEDYYSQYIGHKFDDYICEAIDNSVEKGYHLVLRCTICGHILHLKENQVDNLIHCASRCQPDYYNALIGKQFGDLIIDSLAGYKGLDMTYNCHCAKCGTKSVRSMRALKLNIKHGRECYKQLPDSEYKRIIAQRWYDMYQRCNNPNNDHYYCYGGRGIKLLYNYPIDLYYDYIDEFIEFSKIHGLKNTTFDRIDVNGNYEKGNLRMATLEVQSVNKRRRRIFILRCFNTTIISDSVMACGRYLGLNGHSLGNVVRGNTKSSGGWVLERILDEDEDPYEVIKNEGVTTNLLVSL